jgi:anti-anti-sigma regulatory factor
VGERSIEASWNANLRATTLKVKSSKVVQGTEPFRELVTALERAASNHLVLDLTEVRVADDAIVGEVFHARVRAADGRLQMVLINPEFMARKFGADLLSSMFTIASSEANALAAIHDAIGARISA